jgi:murein endopeptidase
MKIKKTVLVQIIKEETEKVLMEQEITNLPPLSVSRPEGYPTEEELGYLASLGMDDELSTAGGSTLASPENVLNLRHAAVDPTGLNLGYDPKYIPHSNLGHYRPTDREEYVPIHSIQSQQFPELETRMGAQEWNEREMERVAKIADVHQELATAGEGPTNAVGLEVDWDLPDYFDEETDLATSSPNYFEGLPETGGVFVKQNRLRQYGTPHMQDYVRALANVGGGGWYVGDISQEGGGKLRYTRRAPSNHASHQTGTDIDLSLPTIDGGMSTREWRRSRGDAGRRQIPEEWSFRNIGVNDMDYDKTVELLRHTAPRAKYIFLDPIFFPGIRTEIRGLVQSGDMSATEARRIRRVLKDPGDTAHKNHFHIRLRGVYPQETSKVSRGQGKQPERYAQAPARAGSTFE